MPDAPYTTWLILPNLCSEIVTLLKILNIIQLESFNIHQTQSNKILDEKTNGENPPSIILVSYKNIDILKSLQGFHDGLGRIFGFIHMFLNFYSFQDLFSVFIYF